MGGEAKHAVVFVGLGQMGRAMAQRLRAADVAVTGVDPDGGARAATERLGIDAVADIGDAPPADVVMLCLPGPREVREFVDRGLAAPPAHLVNLSTIGPEATVDTARRVRDAGWPTCFVESPISGGVLRAARGEAALLCGADPVAGLAAVEPLLRAMAREVVVFSTPEEASTAKLVNNLAMLATALGTLEALQWGVGLGLPLGALFDALAVGTADSYALRSTLTRSVRHGDFEVGFATRLALKDVELVLDEADERGIELPFAAEIRRQLREGCDAGLEDLTFPALALLRGLAGEHGEIRSVVRSGGDVSP